MEQWKKTLDDVNVKQSIKDNILKAMDDMAKKHPDVLEVKEPVEEEKTKSKKSK